MPSKALLQFACRASPAEEVKIRLLDKIVAEEESSMAAIRYATICRINILQPEALQPTRCSPNSYVML